MVPKTYFGIWKHADDAVNLVWSPPLSSLLAFEETFCNEMEEEHGVEGGCNEEGEDATLKERMHKESNGEGGGNNEEKEVPTVHALKMDDILRLPALKVKDLVDLQKVFFHHIIYQSICLLYLQVEKEREFGIYEHSEYDPFKTIPCSISRAKQVLLLPHPLFLTSLPSLFLLLFLVLEIYCLNFVSDMQNNKIASDVFMLCHLGEQGQHSSQTLLLSSF